MLPGSAKPGRAAERVRDLGQGARMLRNAFDPDLAVDQLEIVGARPPAWSTAARRALSATMQRSLVDGIAGGHGLPAGIGAEPERTRRGVAVGDVDVRRGDAEHAGADLRQHGARPVPARPRRW